jgi:hypothetical protein
MSTLVDLPDCRVRRRRRRNLTVIEIFRRAIDGIYLYTQIRILVSYSCYAVEGLVGRAIRELCRRCCSPQTCTPQLNPEEMELTPDLDYSVTNIFEDFQFLFDSGCTSSNEDHPCR